MFKIGDKVKVINCDEEFIIESIKKSNYGIGYLCTFEGRLGYIHESAIIGNHPLSGATIHLGFIIGDEVQYNWQKGYLGKVKDDTGPLIMVEEPDGNIIWVPSNDLELFELTTSPQNSLNVDYSGEITFETFEEITNRIYGNIPLCECGKDKHGFARHSDYCPKYE